MCPEKGSVCDVCTGTVRLCSVVEGGDKFLSAFTL